MTPRRVYKARAALRLAILVFLWSLPAEAQKAPDVYEKWCTPCHGAGDNKPGTISAGTMSATMTNKRRGFLTPI